MRSREREVLGQRLFPSLVRGTERITGSIPDPSGLLLLPFFLRGSSNPIFNTETSNLVN